MTDALRPFLSRAIAALLATLCSWLARRYQIEVAAPDQQALANAVADVLIPIVVYFTSHRLIDKRVNPDDAASTHAALVGKAKQNQRKRERALTERIKRSGANAPFFRDPEYPDVPPDAPQHRTNAD